MLLEFGNIRLDSASRELWRDGRLASIEPKAFDLLLYLIEHRDRVIAKDELQDEIWGTIVSDSAMTRCVMKLRKALGASDGGAIKTVPRCGYRFVADLDGGPAAGDRPSDRAAGDAPNRPSIAVLPLSNLSSDPDNEYFSDGLAEEILNLLARIPGLRVVSRRTAFSLKGREVDVKTIGAELDVDYVLEGSVRRAGNRVRIAQQLIDARSDTQLWSDIYDRELTDVFEVQAQIAEKVANAIEVTESGQIRAHEDTRSISAYDHFLRGRHYLHRWDRGAIEMSRQCFEQSINADPRYARAWAGLAIALTSAIMWWDDRADHQRRAREASLRALELQPSLADAHVARGFVLSFDGEYTHAAEQFEAAIRLNPMLYEAWYLYARSRFAEGRFREAARLFGRAAEVERDEYQAACLQVTALESLGDIDAARAASARGIRRARRRLELVPDDTRALTLGSGCMITTGEMEEALEWTERALAIGGEDIAVLHNVGCNLAKTGQIDRALDVFEKRFAKGKAFKAWIDNDTCFDPIREHPRFRAMLRT